MIRNHISDSLAAQRRGVMSALWPPSRAPAASTPGWEYARPPHVAVKFLTCAPGLHVQSVTLTKHSDEDVSVVPEWVASTEPISLSITVHECQIIDLILTRLNLCQGDSTLLKLQGHKQRCLSELGKKQKETNNGSV